MVLKVTVDHIPRLAIEPVHRHLEEQMTAIDVVGCREGVMEHNPDWAWFVKVHGKVVDHLWGKGGTVEETEQEGEAIRMVDV